MQLFGGNWTNPRQGIETTGRGRRSVCSCSVGIGRIPVRGLKPNLSHLSLPYERRVGIGRIPVRGLKHNPFVSMTSPVASWELDESPSGD